MNTTLIIVFSFIALMTLILNFIKRKRNRIKPIGDFFKKVLPRIPFTDIARIFREKGKS